MVLPFKEWVKHYSGISEATARRICQPGGTDPRLVRLPARRVGVRLGDHRKWVEAGKR
jgi:hypothetical protein